MPDRSIHKSSDAYQIADDDINLELKVLELNINKRHNAELMKQCKTLHDYAFLIQAIKDALKELSIEEAILTTMHKNTSHKRRKKAIVKGG